MQHTGNTSSFVTPAQTRAYKKGKKAPKVFPPVLNKSTHTGKSRPNTKK